MTKKGPILISFKEHHVLMLSVKIRLFVFASMPCSAKSCFRLNLSILHANIHRFALCTILPYRDINLCFANLVLRSAATDDGVGLVGEILFLFVKLT